jgi:hypothetical protein
MSREEDAMSNNTAEVSTFRCVITSARAVVTTLIDLMRLIDVTRNAFT